MDKMIRILEHITISIAHLGVSVYIDWGTGDLFSHNHTYVLTELVMVHLVKIYGST